MDKTVSDKGNLVIGEVVHDRFFIQKRLGSGSYGEVYRALDQVVISPVAIKTARDHFERIQMEIDVLKVLSFGKSQFIPMLIISGKIRNIMYLVMELLGPSLSDLRKKQDGGRLTISTVLRVGQQAIAGLKELHDIGFLHRDVKPSNMCIGSGEAKCKRIYVVDFGLARQYKKTNGKGFRVERKDAGFVGTRHYASINAHNGVEQGPHDDLWSLFYSLIELAEGTLPWEDFTTREEIKESKESFKFEEFCKYLPKSVKDFQSHLEMIHYNHLPNYSFITSILQNALPSEVSNDSRFDWEESSH